MNKEKQVKLVVPNLWVAIPNQSAWLLQEERTAAFKIKLVH